MRWVIKTSKFQSQIRITLPKTFCKLYDIDAVDYMVIDDRDPTNITIGRLVYSGSKKRDSEDD